LSKRTRFAFCLFWLLLLLAFSTVSFAEGFERKRPSPIPPHSVFRPPFIDVDDSIFCHIQYDSDSVAWFFPDFKAGDGLTVLFDPTDCTADSLYPFKITNVHFYLWDDPIFIWPVEIAVNVVAVDTTTDTLNPGLIIPARFPTHSKTFLIPEDSAYDSETHSQPINLYLDTTFCMTDSFFLEIVYTGGTNRPYPSLVMSDSAYDRPDTLENWLKLTEAGIYPNNYLEWYDAWVLTPGRVIFRVTGHPHALDCNICWDWIPKTSKAKSGMPDFDQYQFGSDSVALSAPTALANCLVWLNAIPTIADPDSLIRLLSLYFATDPLANGGTLLDSIDIGLDSLFEDYSLNLYDTVLQNPQFSVISNYVDDSIPTTLLVGLWQRIDGRWYRIGGHFISAAGACGLYSWFSVSDPAKDMAETGGKGRILPTHHSHSEDHVLHNTNGYVSHDIYVSDLATVDTLGENLWGLKDYSGEDLPWSQFEGLNFQTDQLVHAHAYDPAEKLYAVVEYAIVIFEKSTWVEEEPQSAPRDFCLFQSFPNPFNDQTVIEYQLPKTVEVSLEIYNILGQRVRTLVEKEEQNGSVKVIWNGEDDSGRNLGSGIYFCRLKAGNLEQTQKMVLLK
jgi:hypothetical protein